MPVVPRRTPVGVSAVLLPFHADGSIDWTGFEAHVARTVEAGLAPAVNMDTGYAPLLDDATRIEALKRTRDICKGAYYVAGAGVFDKPGDGFDPAGYQAAIDEVQQHDGEPVVFQSFGLTNLDDRLITAAYAQLTKDADSFIAFELGGMFAPFGKIYSLGVYEQLMRLPNCIGAKHSSLSRQLEWDRLALRNKVRPDFHVFTGNDLAIDMIMYGSDYLLGLSTFAPDLFAKRDQLWADGDASFYEVNDLLQYLGFFAFRGPVPAYKHNAAMFLKLRGWIGCDDTHPGSAERPDSDREVLAELLPRVETLL
ncbi:MAG: dihydrodipicolinate synthase family protein [Phycisphaeraceae bacterium]|nr:dihydrodipicolinate synthase family protein [Phycisphaeraceae bacterium]